MMRKKKTQRLEGNEVKTGKKRVHKRQFLKFKSKTFSCSQNHLQENPKQLESSTLKCEVCKQ